MDMMTATEAGRNFSAAIKKADESGLVWIEKNGKGRYVLMSKEMFDNIQKEQYLGKRGDELCYIRIDGDDARLFQIIQEGAYVTFNVCEVLTSELKLTRKGNNLKVSADFEEARRSGKRSGLKTFFYEDILDVDPEGDESGLALEYLKEVRSIVDQFSKADENELLDIDLEILTPNYKGEKINQMRPL